MYFVYCHQCGFINVYKPGWFANIKFNSMIDTRAVVQAYHAGQISRPEMGFLAGKIQEAMVADGILPSDWIKV